MSRRPVFIVNSTEYDDLVQMVGDVADVVVVGEVGRFEGVTYVCHQYTVNVDHLVKSSFSEMPKGREAQWKRELRGRRS